MNTSSSLQEQRLSGLSVAGFVCAWFIAPVGIILSAIALSEINRNPQTLRGKGFAKWGIGLGALAMVVWVLVIAAAVSESNIRRNNERSDRAVEEYNRR